MAGLGIAEEQERNRISGISIGGGSELPEEPKKPGLLSRLGVGLKKSFTDRAGAVADNPLGFLSLAVQNVAASREGQILPSTILRRERQAQANFEQERVEKGAEMAFDILIAELQIKDPKKKAKFRQTMAIVMKPFGVELPALLEDDEITDEERFQFSVAAIMDPLGRKMLEEGDIEGAIKLFTNKERQANNIKKGLFDETPEIMSILAENLPLALNRLKIEKSEGENIDLPFHKFQALDFSNPKTGEEGLTRKQLILIGHNPELLENFGINLTDSPFPAETEGEFDNSEVQFGLRTIIAGLDLPEHISESSKAILAPFVGKPDEARIAAEGEKTVKPVKITAGERLAATFAQRVVQSNEVIDEIGEQFGDAFSLGGVLPEAFKTKDRQRYEQAKRNFTNAILRRESGAAIAPSEFESAEQQYFPVPGNDAPVLAQKKQNRETVVAGLELEAGEAFKQLQQKLKVTALTHVTIKGEKVAIGTIVTNKKGQNGRVEADGSITLLE